MTPLSQAARQLRRAPIFERLAAVSARGFNLGGVDRLERLESAIVSADFFALLGTQPLRAPPASTRRRRCAGREALLHGLDTMTPSRPSFQA
jgi:hypothetical protein